MGHSKQTRRFRINPVELAVFGVVSLIFAQSVYRLFYDWEEIRTNVGGESTVAKNESEGRKIASNNPLFSTIEIKCDAGTLAKKKTAAEDSVEVTEATKVRLSGPLCGAAKNTETAKVQEKLKLIKAEVINKTTNTAATVFTNATDGSFSTDFIQLNPGRNQIQLRWVYQGGREHSQALAVQKN